MKYFFIAWGGAPVVFLAPHEPLFCSYVGFLLTLSFECTMHDARTDTNSSSYQYFAPTYTVLLLSTTMQTPHINKKKEIVSVTVRGKIRFYFIPGAYNVVFLTFW